MPYERVHPGPLDAEGVRHDRPPSQVRWTDLTNVVFREGKLITRPGFRTANWCHADDIPDSEPGVTMSIHEVWNPGSSATGRESFTPAAESLAPDGHTDVVAGWSGSHLDVDETVPDGTVISSTTAGSQVSFTFANPSTTYATVLGVLFQVRSRIDTTGAFVKLNFYLRVGGVNYLIDSENVTVRIDQEGDAYQDVFVPLDRYIPDGVPLKQSHLTALELLVEYDSGEAFQWENVTAAAVGTNDDWVDAGDGGSVAVGDCDGFISSINVDETSNLPSNNYITHTAADDAQTFTFTLSRTFSSVSSVQVHGFFSRRFHDEQATQLEFIYLDSGGTEYSLGTFTIPGGDRGRIAAIESDTNPADSAAWAAADITGGEFGFRYVGGGRVYCGTFSLLVIGAVAGNPQCDIEMVRARVVGVTSSNPGTGITDKTRLFSSNLAHYRLVGDAPGQAAADVTNSVPLNSTGPGWPIHAATLYGQVFLTNGVDPTVYYPNGSNTYAELSTNNADGATALTGRCVAAFGNRILYGWVKDNATITPERIEYSKINDGSTHNHASAGFFDLLDTPGGVMAMVPLDEQFMAVLKELGCYTVRRTGISVYPFIPDVIDFQTGCLASKTAVRVQQADGSASVLFLGTNTTSGPNVFAFNGSSVVPVGNPIAEKLRDDMNHAAARITAFAECDPQTGTYWLFIPEGTESFPKQAWVMNIASGAWTRAEFPFEVYSAGIWHYAQDSYLNLSTAVETIGGEPRLTIGGGRAQMPLMADTNRGADEIHPPDLNDAGAEDEENLAVAGRRMEVFTQTLTTGDLVKPRDKDVITYRCHLVFKAKNIVNRLLVDASEDGGKTFKTQQEHWIGPDNYNIAETSSTGTAYPGLDGVYYAVLDMTPSNAPQIRYRLRVKTDPLSSDDGTTDLSMNSGVLEQRVELHDIWWSAIEGGADA